MPFGPTHVLTRVALLAVALFGLYFPLAYWIDASFAPNRNATIGPDVPGEKIRLHKPFARQGSSSTSFEFGIERHSLFDDVADSGDDPRRSPIELYEDGQRLGPAHSQRDEIEKLGRGRFSHWRKNGSTIYFSASDNSDPNTNGRSYWAVKPPPAHAGPPRAPDHVDVPSSK